jgi:hypothetical protein
MDRGGGGHISLSGVNVTLADLDPLAFILQIAARLVCSFCEAMAGTLSVASTVVLSAKFAVYSGEVGRPAV